VAGTGVAGLAMSVGPRVAAGAAGDVAGTADGSIDGVREGSIDGVREGSIDGSVVGAGSTLGCGEAACPPGVDVEAGWFAVGVGLEPPGVVVGVGETTAIPGL
jgi:hypothetical protein